MAVALPNARRLADADKSVNVALPNAANTVNTNSIDLEQVSPYPTTEAFQVRIQISAATGANSKNINARIQDSADNSNWTNVAVLGNPILTAVDNANAGFTATEVYVQLPPSIRRYIRVQATGEANGGNAADGTVTATLVF